MIETIIIHWLKEKQQYIAYSPEMLGKFAFGDTPESVIMKFMQQFKEKEG